ncbi:MAG: VIT domain-containing protein [Planctomycetota bacterium]|jgi:Ca-activated chloride channel family protein
MGLRIGLLLTLCFVPALAQEAPATRAMLNGLFLKHYTVSIEADEELATVVVEETFFNAGGGLAEADFYFPLPPGSAASGLQLAMNGRYFGGSLLTRRRAGDIYNRITRRSRDPALLDCVGKDLYRCRVFPVPARDTASVRFAYRHPLASQGALRRLVVPLDAARFNKSPVEDFSLSIHVKTKSGLQAIFCPTHEVKVRQVSAREAFVELSAHRAYLARDLVLLYAVEDAPIGAVVSSYRRGGQGYFVLSVDAAFAREQQAKAPRDVVLAIDTSNSSGRNGVDAAAAAVAEAVGGLRPQDRYALLAFSTDARLLSALRHPARGGGDEVRALFAKQPIAGTTRLGAAIRSAAEVAGQGHPGTGIILLTDGLASQPEQQAALRAAQAAAGAGHRVGVCGVGAGVDTVHLDVLGDRGHGDSAYAARDRKLSDGVRDLFRSTRSAPLSNVEIEIGGVSNLYPAEQQVQRGSEPLLVAGRYTRPGPVQVRIRGKVNGELVAHSFEVRLRHHGGDPSVARMWAARRIGHLLADARAEGDPKLHRGKILALGRRFGIVTPHTSLLVLERDDQKRFLSGMKRRPLLQSAGGGLKDRRTYTRAVTSAELAARIKKLSRCRSGAVDPFADLLGENRLRMRRVGDRTFYRTDKGIWVEGDLLDRRPADPRLVRFLSSEWSELAASSDPDVTRALALGRSVLFRLPDGTAVQVVE